MNITSQQAEQWKKVYGGGKSYPPGYSPPKQAKPRTLTESERANTRAQVQDWLPDDPQQAYGLDWAKTQGHADSLKAKLITPKAKPKEIIPPKTRSVDEVAVKSAKGISSSDRAATSLTKSTSDGASQSESLAAVEEYARQSTAHADTLRMTQQLRKVFNSNVPFEYAMAAVPQAQGILAQYQQQVDRMGDDFAGKWLKKYHPGRTLPQLKVIADALKK